MSSDTRTPYRRALPVVVHDRLLAKRAEAILEQWIDVYGVTDVMFGPQVWTH